MNHTINRDIKESQMRSLKRTAMNNRIPRTLATTAGRGSKYRTVQYQSDTQDIRLYVLPDKSIVEVNISERKEILCFGVVENDEVSGYVPTEEYVNLEFLPSLHQAYHEGDSYRDREADYRYVFNEDETEVAVPASNPVQRLDEPINICAVEYLGGYAPQQWLLETESGDSLYLRERSGSIRLFDEVSNGDEIFNAFIGREHPGTNLKSDGHEPSEDEIIRIVTSVNYINLDDDAQKSVSEETKTEYARFS